MEMPLRVCASISLMPLTLVEIEYWLWVVTRCSISGVERPVSCQITVTTGILISGKMSVGMDTMADTPSTRMSAANTKNVCGNFSAKRTIPMTYTSNEVAFTIAKHLPTLDLDVRYLAVTTIHSKMINERLSFSEKGIRSS